MLNKLPKVTKVALVSCVRSSGDYDYHCVNDKYLQALTAASGLLPVVIPARLSADDVADSDDAQYLDGISGIFLTGSPSNVAPWRYQQDLAFPPKFLDERRDRRSFALLHAALAIDLPVFAVCRGLQELNVALGGSLHQQVHQVAGLNDHRENGTLDIEQQYAFAHPVQIAGQGLLRRIYDAQSLAPEGVLQVNSLHGQGIDRLAPGLQVEARAPDGVIEAISLPTKTFVLGVQWHPEWQATQIPHYGALFGAFGAACRAFPVG